MEANKNFIDLATLKNFAAENKLNIDLAALEKEGKDTWARTIKKQGNSALPKWIDFLETQKKYIKSLQASAKQEMRAITKNEKESKVNSAALNVISDDESDVEEVDKSSKEHSSKTTSNTSKKGSDVVNLTSDSESDDEDDVEISKAQSAKPTGEKATTISKKKNAKSKKAHSKSKKEQKKRAAKKINLGKEMIDANAKQPFITYEEFMKKPVLKGLSNIGNTCYLNSVLQFLANNPTYQEILDTSEHLDSPQVQELKRTLRTIISMMRKPSEEEMPEEVLFYLQKQLIDLHIVVKNEQFDASEILLNLSMLLTQKKFTNLQMAIRDRFYYIPEGREPNHKEVYTDLLQSDELTTSLNLKINQENEKNEPFSLQKYIDDYFTKTVVAQNAEPTYRYLSFNKEDASYTRLPSEIVQSIEESVKQELQLTKHTKEFNEAVLHKLQEFYKSDKQEILRVVLRSVKRLLKTAPEHLILNLNRVKHRTKPNTNYTVKIPEQITAHVKTHGQVGTDDKIVSTEKYDLSSIFLRGGKHFFGSGGHYVLYQKLLGKWYLLNDETVKETTFNEIEKSITAGGYHVLYQKTPNL